MKISNLQVFVVPLDAWGVETRYSAADKLGLRLESTVVRLETDQGLTGWGETVTPLSYYHPTSPESARAAIGISSPLLLGSDPLNHRRIMEDIRFMVRGHEPARSALDMALWDLVGKAHELPLVDLWGGRVADDLPVLCLISTGSADQLVSEIERYRQQGYQLFQIKIGTGSVKEDVDRIEACMGTVQADERCWFDVNRAWSVDKAMQIMSGVRNLCPLIEQPCETYRECLTVARRTGMGLMLDETIHDQDDLYRAVSDGILDVAVLKLSAVGGISEQRHLAELGVRLGVSMRLEDFYGTGITLAAVCHIAQGLPEKATFGLYDYHLPEVPLVKNPFPVIGGRVRVPETCTPGLGVEIDLSVLGKPVAEYIL